MTNLISFPFRLNSFGFVTTKADDSDEYFAEELGCLVGTIPGERPMVPLYGLTDPTYQAVDANEVAIKVGMFGPPVRVRNVEPKWISAGQQDVIIEFEPLVRNPNQPGR